jgi:RNA polymerase sigma-70 factor (ECF subfamily)
MGREDAEDLTQVTLLHTVARVDRFREESTFRHYVFSVARRVLFERYRRAQRRLDTEEPRSEPAASQTTPSERMFRAEFHEQLVDAIASLHDHYRVVVDLYLRGADNFEIAKRLDLEYNTVRSRLSRGLSTVRQQLAPWVVENRHRMLLERPADAGLTVGSPSCFARRRPEVAVVEIPGAEAGGRSSGGRPLE